MRLWYQLIFLGLYVCWLYKNLLRYLKSSIIHHHSIVSKGNQPSIRQDYIGIATKPNERSFSIKS